MMYFINVNFYVIIVSPDKLFDILLLKGSFNKGCTVMPFMLYAAIPVVAVV